MSNAPARLGSLVGRGGRVWRSLPAERRLAAGAAAGFIVVLFLPWYQREYFTLVGGRPAGAADTQSGWQAFSFVEAAVLLVGAGVLTLIFQRGEGRAFHLPGGDGWVVTLAGAWALLLIVWRMFDKQGAITHGQQVVDYGIEWGIFAALADAALLVLAGSRMRAAGSPEPPLPGEEGGEGGWSPEPWEPLPRPTHARARRRRPDSPGKTPEVRVEDPPELVTRRLPRKPPEPPSGRKPERPSGRTPDAPPAEEQLTISFDDPGRPA